ncbi:hypothetical protein CEUSTIGMA_g10034.t1 [Chlamydomonas eustigma]|uniref:PBP domain-containing protein n=1 Tax=Chlamydomonas eustigma TaxID=1157962 RepID=A0A250XHQ8_9CHLO|nr:hypothetical protein CEUSTIGMA_g10034.t1 [Chlamydomonas eustigma]|eukprot:GAX82608.1 hypothetical protein CEUSTIGMA_g10034.t1 [Chlamydomonas eustigma]
MSLLSVFSAISLSLLHAQYVASGAVGEFTNVDGSGSETVAPVILKVMELVSSMTTPLIGLSYRTIGTGPGQLDLINDNSSTSANAFTSGDFPLSRDAYEGLVRSGNTPLQIPFLLSRVSFFVNIPSLAVQGQLKLSCSILAQIYQGSISTWNHPAIVLLNPTAGLQSVTYTIPVLRMASIGTGSDSTYGITHYFISVCPDSWKGWDVGTAVSQWAPSFGIVVNSSAAMAAALSDTSYSLGYLQSNIGLSSGLTEVSINSLNASSYLTSQTSDTVPAYLSTLLQPQLLPLPTEDWSAYSILSNASWPITMMSYIIIRQNLSWLGNAGGLLLNFLQVLLSTTACSYISSAGLLPLPLATQQWYLNYLSSPDNVMLDPNATITWVTEAMNPNISLSGADSYVVSSYRSNYISQTVFNMQTAVSSLSLANNWGAPYQVQGSGSFVATSAINLILQQISSMSKVPLYTSYRQTGLYSDPGISVVDYTSNIQQNNHFQVGLGPLTSSQYAALSYSEPVTGGIMQIPFAASPLGIYYNQQIPGFQLSLTACQVALLLSRNITSWSDPRLQNPSAGVNMWPLPNPAMSYPITVKVYTLGHANLQTMSDYLQRACPSVTTNLTVLAVSQASQFNGQAISSPDTMVAALQGTPHSIGFVQNTWGDSQQGLSQVTLQNKFGYFVTANASTAQSAMSSALQFGSTIPLDWSQDWGSLSVIDASGFDNWPITQVLFFYVYKSLAAYQSAAPAAQAFLNFTLSNMGQQLVSSSGLAGLTQQLQLFAYQAVQNLTLAPGQALWTYEPSNDFSNAGSRLNTLSGNREAALMAQISQLQSQLQNLTQQLQAALPVTVKTVASGDANLVVSQGLSVLQDYATQPLRASVEYVPGQQAAAQRLLSSSASTTAAQIAILDAPLTTAQSGTFSEAAVQPLQVPLFIRSVSLVFMNSQLLPAFNFAPCTVAAILRGDVTRWTDPTITSGLPSNITQLLPSRDFQVLTASLAGGDYLAMKQYATVGCPSKPLYQEVAVQTGSGMPEDVIASLSSASPMSIMGIVSRYLLDATGLGSSGTFQEVALQSTTGLYINSSGASLASYVQLMDSALSTWSQSVYSTPRISSANTGNWSSLNLVLSPSTRTLTYPVIRLDYIVIPADLSTFNNSGGAAVGAASFLTCAAYQGQMASFLFLYPGLMPLGPIALQYASDQMQGSSFHLASGVTSWPIVNQSTSSLQGPAVVTGISVVLPEQINNLRSISDYYQSYYTLQSALAANQNATSTSNQALHLAVAALVLSIVLPSVAIVLLAVALIRQQKRANKEDVLLPEVSMQLSEGGRCLPIMSSAEKDRQRYQVDSFCGDRLSVDLLPKKAVPSDRVVHA